MKRILFGIGIMAVSTNMALPMFRIFEARYHAGDFTPISLFLVYLLMLVPSLLLAGALSERIGPKAVALSGLGLAFVSALLFAFGASLPAFYFARGIAGISIGLFMGTANALLVQNQTPGRSPALKISSIVTFVGFGLGPAISSLSLQYNEWISPERSPFWLLIAGQAASFILLMTVRQSWRPSAPLPKFSIKLGVPQSSKALFWTLTGASSFTLFALNGAVMALVPVYVHTVMHSDNLAWSGLLLLLLLGGSTLGQLLPFAAEPVQRIRYGLLLLLTGFWLMLAAGLMTSMPVLWIAFAIQAIGGGWISQPALGLAGQMGSEQERPRVLSTYWLVTYSGSIFPTFGVGLLSLSWGLMPAMLLLAGVFTVVAAAIAVNSWLRTDQTSLERPNLDRILNKQKEKAGALEPDPYGDLPVCAKP